MSDSLELTFSATKALSTDMWEHMERIRYYASQCESIVEFGVYDCTSTWALLAGRPKSLISYDIARRLDVDDVERVAAEHGLSFKFMLCDSLKAQFGETDLLFIDSLHTYDHLSAELRTHGNSVKKYIILHDTTTFEFCEETPHTGRGLWPAIEEFLAANPHWSIKERFTCCHGLTVLQRT